MTSSPLAPLASLAAAAPDAPALALAAASNARLPGATSVPGIVPSAQTSRAFFAWLLSVLPRALALEAIAWIVCFCLLAAGLKTLKSRMKPGLMNLDDNIRAWAKGLRYKAQHPNAGPEEARQAARFELEAQKQASEFDRPLDQPPSASRPASASTSESSAASPSGAGASTSATTAALASPASSNGRLWIDGNHDAAHDADRDGRDDRDRNYDGSVSEAERIAAELDDDEGRERVPLSWFFRFWTNFASAPCLSAMSLLVPLYAAHRAGGVSTSALWLSQAFPHSFAARALAQNIAPTRLAFLAAAGLSAPALRAARVWTAPGLCYAGGMFMSFWLKKIFKRLRPQRKPGGFGHKLKDGSFPSGHSLTSFCFWCALVAAAAHAGASTLQLVGLGATSVTIVGLTGLSRVYLGVHFPSDVLGGFGIALAWCIISLPVLRWALHI
jgi:undecaprenyl-diphosphatase